MDISHSKPWLLMTGTQGHCFPFAILQSIQVAFIIGNANMPQICCRIGRTGRAHRQGKAITFFEEKDSGGCKASSTAAWSSG